MKIATSKLILILLLAVANCSLAQVAEDSLYNGPISFDDSAYYADFDMMSYIHRYSGNINSPFSHQIDYSLSSKSSWDMFLILVDARVYDSISEDISTYAQDILNNTHYNVVVDIVSGGGHTDIRELLQTYYFNKSIPGGKSLGSLVGAVLVGDIPTAIFEAPNDDNISSWQIASSNNDTNSAKKYRAWPCDLYYMDLNGVWVDSSKVEARLKSTNPPFTILDSVYPDSMRPDLTNRFYYVWVQGSNGFYDFHSGNVDPEIFIGRINGAHLGVGHDGYGSPDFISRQEINALHRYFAKNHKYWANPKNYQYKALSYIDHPWKSNLEMKSVGLLYGDTNCSSIGCVTHMVNKDAVAFDSLHFGGKDYSLRIRDSSLGYVFVAVHSGPPSHEFQSPYDSIVKKDSILNPTTGSCVYIYDTLKLWHQVDSNKFWADWIYSDTMHTHFIGANLFACSACDWTKANDTIGYLGGSYLFGPNNACLALTGSTKSGSMKDNFIDFYSWLGEGNSIGNAYLSWWKLLKKNTAFGFDVHDWKTAHWHYGMTLMGDPLVSMVDQGVDLYVADSVDDYGYEPSSVRYMYNSPDIWIENMQGGCVANPVSGMDYMVCVRIHNRNFRPSTGRETLTVNWAKSSLNLPWPAGWNGQQLYESCHSTSVAMGGLVHSDNIPIIGAFSDTIVRFRWHVPDITPNDCGGFAGMSAKWHFGLLARIYDGHEIEGEYIDGYPIDALVLRNNNVAWKNLTILRGSSFYGVASFQNNTDIKKDYNLILRLFDNRSKESLLDFAEITMSVPSELTSSWSRNKVYSSGMSLVSDRDGFAIESSLVELRNLTLDSNECRPIGIEVSFLADKVPSDSIFGIIIEQWDDSVMLGGVYFQAIRAMDRNFSIEILGEPLLMPSQQARFYAEDILEPAQYRWLDASGNTINEGMELDVSPTKTQRYILEVTAESDNYKDYSEVTAIVRKGIVVSISPNPASNATTISYIISEEVQTAYLLIQSASGNNYRVSDMLTVDGSVMFNLQGIPPGLYNVVLMSGCGEPLDSKTIVIY